MSRISVVIRKALDESTGSGGMGSEVNGGSEVMVGAKYEMPGNADGNLTIACSRSRTTAL